MNSNDKPLRLRVALATLTLVLAATVAGAAEPDTTVLLRRGGVEVTRADYDAELLRIPEKDRADFAANPRRNRQILERMLATRELAARAREKKLDQDPMLRVRMRAEEDRLLAAALIQQAMDGAALDYELRLPAFERRAREVYEIDKAKYAAPESVMVTLIFFAADKDGFDGAQKRADAALAKIKAGADIGDLAATASDDATTKDFRGRKGPLSRADLDTVLGNEVFALKKVGDLTGAVRTREGLFVVRLDARKAPVPRTFDEVKGEIMADLKQRQIDAARDAVLASAGDGKTLGVNEKAIEALRSPAKASK